MLDLIITGVGGQGNVLASRIIAQAAMEVGYEVRTSEAIGMAQREGMVMSQVRIGNGLYGALVPDGKADILLGFELAETVRGLTKLKKNGTVVANDTTIYPVSTVLGESTYQPDMLRNYLTEHIENLYLFDATTLAAKAGTPKATNIVLLGALAALKILPITYDKLLQVILQAVPAKFKNINKLAFEMGFQSVEV